MEDIQHQQMGYDRAATMFAPDGRILQVEYAEKTIRLGSASVGIVCKDGVVIVSDRGYKDKLVMEESANKINEIDDHIIAVWAGVSSDARVLVEKARLLAQQHRVTYDSPSGTEAIVQEIADIKQQFTQYGGSRPFGVSMILLEWKMMRRNFIQLM
jgi:proteasome alpha subunit